MKKRLRIRVGGSYNARYNTHHCACDVDLVIRPLTPLTRISEKLDSFAFIEPGGYDLVHSFNAIPVLTRTPFIVTFEDYCPRTPADRPMPRVERWLRKALLSKRCIAIIAMSNYALRKFRHQHQNHPHLSSLLAKTQVVHPAMAATGIAPKSAAAKLRLLFVGTDFMRKGGPAVLEAHRRLRALGIPVETTVVSALRWSEKDYIGPPDPRRSQSVMNSIEGSGITHYLRLEHHRTLELMRQADYLLLPTLHDTFGYVSLEAMSLGTPSIATSTCAQSEIIEHGKSGFLLDFDNDPVVGEWSWLYGQRRPEYVEAYWQTIEKLAAELTECLAVAWDRRNNYEQMSAAAIQRIAERFDTGQARRRLTSLYQRAVLQSPDTPAAACDTTSSDISYGAEPN